MEEKTTTYIIEEKEDGIVFKTNNKEIKDAITAYIQTTINAVLWEKYQKRDNIYGHKLISFGFTGSKETPEGDFYMIVFNTNAPEWVEEITRYIEHYIHNYNYQHMAHDMSAYEVI